MARNCSAAAESQDIEAGIVDMGIDASDAHTAFSKNPDTAVNAFIDFLYLLDAKAIVTSGSSVSTAVATIKGYDCFSAARCHPRLKKCMLTCLPSDCF